MVPQKVKYRITIALQFQPYPYTKELNNETQLYTQVVRATLFTVVEIIQIPVSR